VDGRIVLREHLDVRSTTGVALGVDVLDQASGVSQQDDLLLDLLVGDPRVVVLVELRVRERRAVCLAEASSELPHHEDDSSTALVDLLLVEAGGACVEDVWNDGVGVAVQTVRKAVVVKFTNRPGV